MRLSTRRTPSATRPTLMPARTTPTPRAMLGHGPRSRLPRRDRGCPLPQLLVPGDQPVKAVLREGWWWPHHVACACAMRPQEASRLGNAGWRARVQNLRLPHISFDVIDGEDLEDGETNGKGAELPDELAANCRRQRRLGGRVVHQTAVIGHARCSEIPARKPHHRTWRRLDEPHGPLFKLREPRGRLHR